MTINVTEDGKVTKEIIRAGTGVQAKEGDCVKVHYVGTLESDGSKFDSSRDRGDPFEFTVGKGVITGWSLGVATMLVGELSKFTIAAEYGYGESGSPPKIPGGATLVFEIELLNIHHHYATKEEAVAAAEDASAKGGDAFRAGDFASAIARYTEGLDSLSHQYGDDIDAINLKLNRNLAVATAKVADWKSSLAYADKVLAKEEKDPRALLRKAEAALNLGDLVNARKALDKGLAVTKNDPTFVALRGKIDAAEKADRQREAQLFKKMTAAPA
jgi:hypothetical protein